MRNSGSGLPAPAGRNEAAIPAVAPLRVRPARRAGVAGPGSRCPRRAARRDRGAERNRQVTPRRAGRRAAGRPSAAARRVPRRAEPGGAVRGERQLIALARAYPSPARLAILDEATSQLDPDAAARAESAFAARPGTLIVIAHRTSSALRADRVLVLDGTRAQIGEHAALLASSPLYRDLVGHWQAGQPPALAQKLIGVIRIIPWLVVVWRMDAD